MIIHQHQDGSRGFQYEVGDRVLVKRTINGGWFDFGPTHSELCTIARIEDPTKWRISLLEVHFSPEWGFARCFPWHLEPHPDTTAAAKVAAA